MVLRRLVISNFVTRKSRVALTVAAIALSVSLVVSVTSGYASVEAAAFKFLSSYLGAHDAQLTRAYDPRKGIDESLVEEMRRDPDVENLTARLELETGLIDTVGRPLPGRPASVIGIRRPEDKRVETMEMEEGGWFDNSDEPVAVIDQIAARYLKDFYSKGGDNAPQLHVGDTFTLPGSQSGLKLKVVGIVHKPALIASQVQTIYMPIQTLQKFILPDSPHQVTRVMINLKDNVSTEQFVERWRGKLKTIDPLLKLRSANESHGEMEKNLQGLHILSYLGGCVSMLAATFIVFSALSMGVAERQRTLAMLRAIGAYRSQLGKLVVLEGILLAAIGILVGVPLGWLWVHLLAWKFSKIFVAGVVLSWGGVLFATAGSLFAALLASFLPAWTAMRLSPLEAMVPLAKPTTARTPILCALLGILLASLDSILLFAPIGRALSALGVEDGNAVAREVQFYLHFAVGIPGLMIGFFLMAPLFVYAIERVAGRIVAPMFGLRYAMLRQQLSGGIWRAAGTCAALMVGLAILIVMQTQGHSMLGGWRLPTRFPDIFIVSPPLGGLNSDQVGKLQQVQGIKRVMPIAIAAPGLGTNFFAIAGAAMMPDSTLFFGVDPDIAFDVDNPMMDLDFRAGNLREAKEMLKKGRHVIVTEEFRQIKGLSVGDKLPLKTPVNGLVDYTIAGVVWSPGMDVFNGFFDMSRQLDQRTGASVFGTLDDAKRDFGIQKVNFFAADLEPSISREQLLKQVQQGVGQMGMKAGDVRQIKHNIQRGFERMLLLVSTVAFAAMAVASLGVANTIMASIRSRRWQFGILRSIGVTRGGLLRLVLAEAMLLGLVGCALGAAAGAQMSVDARAFSTVIIGYMPPVVIPWGIIWIGLGIVILISFLASIGPALGVARTEPLELLQAGRAST
jgi:putative ABC transport system permease protein